jgi:PAS domain S-box-containing protein
MTESKQPTILILEDDVGVARLQQRHLERAGYSVNVTGTSAEALTHIERSSVDLLLLDYRLPGQGTGLDFYAHLKTSGRDLPVILVTGFSDDATVVKALRAGVRDFVTKSSEYLGYLPEAVRRVLEQVHTERQLAELNARLAAVINSALDAVITVGADSLVTMFNPAAEAMFRCPNLAAIGQPIDRFVPEISIVAPGNRRTGDTGAELGPDANSLPKELRGVRADGAELLLEVSVTHVVVTGQPVLTLFVRDITERKRAEEEKRQIENLNRAVLDSLSANIAVLDPLGNYLSVNEAWQTFAEENQLVGHSWLTDNYLETVERAANSGDALAADALAGIKAVLQGDLPSFTQEYPCHSPTTNRWFHMRVGKLVGERMGVVISHTDITERKKAEESLLKSNRSLEEAIQALNTKNEEVRATTQQLWHAAKLATVGELAAGIAHELNNPLATVCLRVESVLSRTPADDVRRRPLEVVQQEAKRMGALVAGLLQFSRRSRDESSSVDVRDELLKALELIQHMMRKRLIKIVQDLAQDLPTVFADRQKLRQLFLNLLTNAIDAMSEAGTLTLRAGPCTLENGQAAVQIDIADTGGGIPPEYLEKVMEPFFTTKEEGKGTGLGLAICRRVVQEHKGTMQIFSEEGTGTTVRVILPLTEGKNVTRLRSGPAAG